MAWPPMGWRAGARNALVFIDVASVEGAHSVQLQATGSWKEKIFRCCVSLPVLVWCCHGLFSTWTARRLVTATVLTSVPPTAGDTTASATLTRPTPTVASTASAGGKSRFVVYWHVNNSTLVPVNSPHPPRGRWPYCCNFLCFVHNSHSSAKFLWNAWVGLCCCVGPSRSASSALLYAAGRQPFVCLLLWLEFLAGEGC